jgi:threonine dehydrogenase-like Zn-dependent dehydrogenase
MEATLQLMAEGKLRMAPLVTHRTPSAQADRMYQMVREKSEPFLGIVIEWET